MCSTLIQVAILFHFMYIMYNWTGRNTNLFHAIINFIKYPRMWRFICHSWWMVEGDRSQKHTCSFFQISSSQFLFHFVKKKAILNLQCLHFISEHTIVIYSYPVMWLIEKLSLVSLSNYLGPILFITKYHWNTNDIIYFISQQFNSLIMKIIYTLLIATSSIWLSN